MKKKEEAEEYYSKDFEWDQLRQEIETNPSLSYHYILSFNNQTHTEIDPPLSSSQDSQAWNSFHLRHFTGKFFKVTSSSGSAMATTTGYYLSQERRYLLKEFPELASCDEHCKVLEVGCGNGSTALPILRGNDSIIVYACDCSNEALERAKAMINSTNIISSATHRFQPFCCDFSTNGFPEWLACNLCREKISPKPHVYISDVNQNNWRGSNYFCPSKETNCCIGGVDFICLIFTLSAVPVHRMPAAIAECFSVLKPGGLLLFRDYGLYDMTMLRFEAEQRVGFREYMRSDGTRSYFFCLESTRDLFVGAGFIEVELEYCCINSVNRRNGKTMQRVWIHGKFRKPVQKILQN
ncbi:hypothetical protein LguiB_035628 [Lonicera macranthoides]